MARWPESVSYTHLDVYKRQVSAEAPMNSVPIRPDAVKRSAAEAGVKIAVRRKTGNVVTAQVIIDI